jgi:hypothetical protein
MYDEQKSHEHELAPELIALERQLRGMTPAPPRVDRDRLMFAAGQAAGAASKIEPDQDGRARYDEAGHPVNLAGPSWAGRSFWPAATFAMMAATVLLATMLIWQNRSQSVTPQIAGPHAVVDAVDAARGGDVQQADRFASRDEWPAIPRVTTGYLGVRHIALTRGVGALGSESPAAGGDADSPIDRQHCQPATVRGLLNELLPTTPSEPTRS